MSTDATSSTPEPGRPQAAAIHPQEDYPDPRNELQRQGDESTGAEQSGALTDVGPDPHRLIDEIIAGIQAERRETLRFHLDSPPLQFDVLPRPGPPGQPDQPDLGDTILVASGELLLRVPADAEAGPGPDTAAGPAPPTKRRPRLTSPTACCANADTSRSPRPSTWSCRCAST